jgi:hypothetical protein
MLTPPLVGPDLDGLRRSVRWQVALQAMGHGTGAPSTGHAFIRPDSCRRHGTGQRSDLQECAGLRTRLSPSPLWGRLPPIAPGGSGWIDP